MASDGHTHILDLNTRSSLEVFLIFWLVLPSCTCSVLLRAPFFLFAGAAPFHFHGVHLTLIWLGCIGSKWTTNPSDDRGTFCILNNTQVCTGFTQLNKVPRSVFVISPPTGTHTGLALCSSLMFTKRETCCLKGTCLIKVPFESKDKSVCRRQERLQSSLWHKKNSCFSCKCSPLDSTDLPSWTVSLQRTCF